MSKESAAWLNTQTLIGFTDKRGHAWHYKASEQGAEPNHYPGAIPVEDVRRRLFSWSAESGPVYVNVGAGDAPIMVHVPDLQAIYHSDTLDVFKIFKDGYVRHQYDAWLIDNVQTIMTGDLGIGSAGLLRNGGQAWVSVEVPDNVTTPEGVTFRPNLLACTSHDGTLATTYKRVVTLTVCDNTLSAALGEDGQTYKRKHSRYSELDVSAARDALAMIHGTAEDFTATVARLTRVDVSDKAWRAFVDAHAPLPAEAGRSFTMAERQREELSRLWHHDSRVSPWRGTAFGVVQAVNTYAHHYGVVRGASRPERNMSRAVTGDVDTLDASTLATLTRVLATV
jgi:phage/plasmid-like protein (TIGR03299 family)